MLINLQHNSYSFTLIVQFFSATLQFNLFKCKMLQLLFISLSHTHTHARNHPLTDTRTHVYTNTRPSELYCSVINQQKHSSLAHNHNAIAKLQTYTSHNSIITRTLRITEHAARHAQFQHPQCTALEKRVFTQH